MIRTHLAISGMSCAACQSHVQMALQKQPGVANAAVNLMTRDAIVDYDPAVIDPDALLAAVRATGYGAELPTADHATEDKDAARDAEYRDLRRRAIVSLVAGVAAMFLSVPPCHGRVDADAGTHHAVAL